jgi:hypothetical protein
LFDAEKQVAERAIDVLATALKKIWILDSGFRIPDSGF